MATFRNRKGKWQARVVRKGYPAVAKSCQSKQDAEKWARQIEAEIDRGSFVSTGFAEKTTLRELIERYIAEVTPTRRSVVEDTCRLKKLSKHLISRYKMSALTPSILAQYRDERLRTVSAGTIIRELSSISSIINHARREWGVNIANPVVLVKKPVAPQGRNRILDEAETIRLLENLSPTARRNNWMQPLVRFTLETAMRRGELLSLRWSDIDLDKQTAFLELTKNGESRTVPLSSTAIKMLRELPRSIDSRVFPLKPQTVAAAFMKAVKRAEIEDFHFHDC